MGKSHWNIRDMCRSWEINHHLTLRNRFIQAPRFYSVNDKSISSWKILQNLFVENLRPPPRLPPYMTTTTYSSLLYTVIWYAGAHSFRKTLLFISAQSPVTKENNGHRTAEVCTTAIGGFCHVFDYLTGKKVKLDLCTSWRHVREWKYGSTDS